jgi:type I restriction enzyme S subunit
MAIFRSEVNQYLYHFIRSPLFRQMIDEVNTTTINQITQNNLCSTLAPIPPLAEQGRIVAKVDELMALVDLLETQLATSRAISGNLLEALEGVAGEAHALVGRQLQEFAKLRD